MLESLEVRIWPRQRMPTGDTSSISGEEAIRTEELPSPGDFQDIGFFSDIGWERGKGGRKLNYPYGGFIQKFLS